MNASPLLQTVGNVCVGLAALIYALPLQVLLFELSHKRNDHGQGTIVGLFLFVPMWLLLLGALCCVIAGGGLDGLRLSRGWLYPLTVVATLAMLALSFLVFEFPRHPDFFTRLIGRVPGYVLPPATMLFVALSLNPRFTSAIPLPPVRWTWLACAGLSLALCGGFLGWRVLRIGTADVMGLASATSRRGVSDRDILATLPTLDPQRDFAELLRRAGPGESRAVREAATARLRANPDFLETLAATLNSHEPGDGLSFLFSAELSSAERTRLALPARNAIERFTSDIPAPNYLSSDRRKQLLSWGRRTFPVIIEKFSGAGVDFSSVMPAFEHALRPDDTRRR